MTQAGDFIQRACNEAQSNEQLSDLEMAVELLNRAQVYLAREQEAHPDVRTDDAAQSVDAALAQLR